MPSFQDSAIIVILALLLFGPKGMAKLARELGKLMGEFRRASADFRYQMEEEFRVSEQADQQKKIAAMEAAAPVAYLPINAAIRNSAGSAPISGWSPMNCCSPASPPHSARCSPWWLTKAS